MPLGQSGSKPHARVGTTSPIFVPRVANPQVINPGEYFWIKVHSAQASFRGSIFERVKQLIVTSKVNLHHPILGNEDVFAIQRSRAVKRNEAAQLGLSSNLVSLVPATMPSVSVSIEYVLDKENNLVKLGSLINSDSFLAAISLAPGAAAVAKTVGGLAQGIIQTFIPAQEQQPILQFAGDFNLGKEEADKQDGRMRDGYYVILGTRHAQDPLPDPLPKLEIQEDTLLADGKSITQLSYVVLDITRLPVRTRDLSEGAAWDAKLRKAEGMAQEVADDPFVDDDDKHLIWNKCKALLQEAKTLLVADANYAPREADAIYQTVYKWCVDTIVGRGEEKGPVSRGAELEIDTKAERRTLGIAEEGELDSIVSEYDAQAATARQILNVSGDIQYHDMIIEASDFERVVEGEDKFGRFKVRVFSSPAGEMKPEEAVPVAYDERQLLTTLKKLETRSLDQADLIDLGRVLALLLLPPGEEGTQTNVRDLYIDSLKQIGRDQGLRLRLRLPPALAAMPWEYMYVDRAGGGDGMDGFLALDPRVAIIRHEALPTPSPLPAATGSIKVVAALASGENLPTLDLKTEKADLQKVLGGQAGIEPVILEDATLDDVQTAMSGADVFHFAGHGAFKRDEMTDLPGVYTGDGFLALQDQFVKAEQLGINLQGNGVRLALLGGCETGRRDGYSVWSGIAPALVRAEIPAVVANQYNILDKTAIAFSRHFYRALVGGLPIERAVSAGRIGTYNADPGGRDWGVAVLYLRAADGKLFVGAPDDETRKQAKSATEAKVNIRVGVVEAGAVVRGPNVHKMLAGKLDVDIGVAGVVYGSVSGGRIGELSGGSVKFEIKTGDVKTGGSIEGPTIELIE